jgi:CheY-like chemotaxis protein
MSKRILVVEDQPDNRQIIRDMLAPTDYEITEVESGEEALAAIAGANPMSAFDPKRTPPNSSLTTSRLLIHPGVEVATSQYINLH